MKYQFLRLEIQPPVATITLDRAPENLLHIDMMEEVNHALLAVRRKSGVAVLVLRGAHGLFSKGIDYQELARDRVQRLLQVYSRIFESIRMMRVISIAAVEGHAFGGGFELALGCNLIVAADNATFALPEIRSGLIPPIACIVLPRIAPRRRAMEWILTGNEIGVEQLYHDGIVTRLFPAGAFDEGLASFLEELSSKSAPVLQLAKRAQTEAYYSTYEEALYKVQNIFLRELAELADAREGVRAYLAGRAASWRNR
ncbi:MAG TPA: enoyl-CoA hydratase/isomerase family protein [Longimicrobiales bacterium]